MRVIKQSELDRERAVLRAKANASGRVVTGVCQGIRTTIYPAFDGRNLTMDERKKAFRSVV